MAGSKKAPRWQRVALEKFEELKDHPDFEEDIATLRNIQKSASDLLFHKASVQLVLLKYGAPRGLIPLVEHYVIYGEANPSVIKPPIFIVSEIDGEVLPDERPKWMAEAYFEHLATTRQKRVYLDITGEVQRKDIDDFLNTYFKKLIEPKLRKIERLRPGKIKYKLLPGRDYRIIRLYKEKKADRAKSRRVYREIEQETSYDPETIKKVIEIYNRQKKYDLYDNQISEK